MYQFQGKDEQIDLLMSYAPFGIILTDENSGCIYANKRWTEISGLSIEKSLGKGWLNSMNPKDREIITRGWFGLSDTGRNIQMEFHLVRPDDTTIWIEGNSVAIRNEKGVITDYLCAFNDITSRKRTEEERLVLRTKLLEAQKMESIGTLAAGVAHDFNNILSIIMGYVSLLSSNVDDRVKIEKSLAVIMQAAQRGADLVQQILTFARRKDAIFTPFEINPMIKDLVKMLTVTFPKTIQITTDLGIDVQLINGDASQIHQAILNICVNARDAMLTGGKINIQTEVISGSSIRGRFPKALENQYVKISVTDSGEGMSEQTLRRIFEPFFTTKIPGKGTGLGLAVVYGVVEAHNGLIDVLSQSGSGSTFILYFPIPPKVEKNIELEDIFDDDAYKGSKTILIIEDEVYHLTLLKDLIEAKGHTVLTAIDGRAGLESFINNKERIDILICDQDLPHMNGLDVLSRIWEINPSLRVILISGYFNPKLKTQLKNKNNCYLLEKPFKPQILFKTIGCISNN